MSNNKLEILLRLRDEATKKLKKSLGVVNSQVSKTSNKMAALGQSIRKHWLGAVAAIAAFMVAVRGITSAINAFADFEKGLANIKILLGDNKKETILFEKEVRKLSVTFGIMTGNLLKSAFDVQSAVGNTAKSLGILNAATKLAVAGGSDLRSTTSGLVTLMESYGDKLKGAGDASDLLFIAQVRARATIGELASSVGSFLPLAAKLDIGVEDVLASFSKMTVVLGNVNESSTAMTGILNGLIKPTKELKDKVKDWFGVSVQQAVQQGHFLALMKKLGEVSEEEIGRMIPRIRGLKGLLAVSQAIGDVQQQSLEFKEREGITDRNAAEQMETTRKQIDKLKASWHELNIEIGQFAAPPALGVLTWLSDQTKFLRLIVDLYKAANTEADKTKIEKPQFSAEEQGRAQLGLPGMPSIEEAETILTDMEDRLAAWHDKIRELESSSLESFLGIEDLKIEKLLQTTDIGQQIVQKGLLAQLEAKRQEVLAEGKMDDDRVKKLKAIDQAKNKIMQQSTVKQMTMIASQAAGTLGALANFLQQSQGESEKYAGVIKGIRIAEAVMNTATAVTNALTTQPFFPVGIAMGALAAATGAIQIATIAAAAEGGIITRGGKTLVGERGPEIVDFPGGARITPLTTGGAGGTTYINVEINNPSIRSDSDIDDLVEAVSRQLAYETDRIR